MYKMAVFLKHKFLCKIASAKYSLFELQSTVFVAKLQKTTQNYAKIMKGTVRSHTQYTEVKVGIILLCFSYCTLGVSGFYPYLFHQK